MWTMSGYELLKQSDSVGLPERGLRFSLLTGRRVGLAVLVILGFITTTVLLFPPRRFYFHEDSDSLQSFFDDDSGGRLQQCPANIPPQAKPPAPVNVWASLSIDETVAISKWLASDERDLNLTRADEAKLNDNLIFLVEAFRPTKAAALAYLDAPSAETLPQRFARVTIHHGAAQEPYIADYLVGPLPISGNTTLSPLTEIYHRDTIPYNARGFIGFPFAEIEPILREILTPLKDVVKVGSSIYSFVSRVYSPTFLTTLEPQDLFGSHVLEAGSSGPFSFDGTFRRAWVTWKMSGPGNWLQPVGFYQYIDCSGNDRSQWKILKVRTTT